MSFLDEFQATGLELLPIFFRKKYALLRDIDKSLQEIQRQNEQRCEQEIEYLMWEIRARNITPNTSLIRFSDDARGEQKHGIRIADEQVPLAVQAHDLVDTQIQQLDQYLKNFDEELRCGRDGVATTVSPASSLDGSTKSGRSGEGGRGGRKNIFDVGFVSKRC
ncbi:hypothetical protein AB3S75_047021 [Citrus x aurantiifolia]